MVLYKQYVSPATALKHGQLYNQDEHTGPCSAVSNMSDCSSREEIDHERISMAVLLPSADSRRVVVSYKGKYVHKVLVNRLVNLAQEKSVVR